MTLLFLNLHLQCSLKEFQNGILSQIQVTKPFIHCQRNADFLELEANTLISSRILPGASKVISKSEGNN